MSKQCSISPIVRLAAKRCMARRVHSLERLRTPNDITNALQQKRKEYLGSDLELESFVRVHGKPIPEAVDLLSQYLGRQTAFYLNAQSDLVEEVMCEEFFYHCLQLYAYGCVGDSSFDDLIRLAEVYAQEPEIIAIIADDDLPEAEAKAWKDWLLEHDQAPYGFVNAAIGAVSTLLGVLPDRTHS